MVCQLMSEGWVSMSWVVELFDNLELLVPPGLPGVRRRSIDDEDLLFWRDDVLTLLDLCATRGIVRAIHRGKFGERDE